MGKLERAAEAAGEPVDAFIERMIAEEGTIHKAAVRLGVYPNTIKAWLERNNMRIVTRRVVEPVGEPHA